MEIDLTFLSQIDPQVIRIAAIALGATFGLLFFVFLFRGFLEWFWLPARQLKFLQSLDYTLLAIDVPKENLQSPKAVESVFTTIAGAYSGKNKKEKYIEGQVQIPFSLEIVSLDGYIQFLIRTPVMFRDLVEGAFFAQYPDVEITEVHDYVTSIPEKFPDDTYDLWGTELTLMKPDVYPIRTYPFFEHSLSQEFKDPMAALLEAMSRFRQGEQGWLQFVITPTSSAWIEKGQKEVKKLIGEKMPQKKTWGDKLTDPLLSFFHWSADVIVVQGEKSEQPTKREEPVNRIQHMTPGEQLVLTGMQTKLSKTAFSTTARFIYAAPKSVFSKPRGVASVMGALGQFNSMDLNSLIPSKGTKTSADYLLVNWRMAKKQNRILQNYRTRLGERAAKPFIFNTEELATVFHFPDMAVKAPLVKKTEAKRSEPPVSLPSELVETQEVSERFSDDAAEAPTAKPHVPEELQLDLQNSYFEERFAVDAPVKRPPAQRQTRDATPAQPQQQPPQKKSESDTPSDGGAPTNLPM